MQKRGVKPLPLIQTNEERLQCAICAYLLNGPLQFSCGHRICMPCARKLKQDNALTFYCKKCKETIRFSDELRLDHFDLQDGRSVLEMGRNCNTLFVDAADRDRYECPFCFLILKDPLQLECGHRVCKGCFEIMLTSPGTSPETSARDQIKCLNCEKSVRYENCFKDKACAKELQFVKVGCRWKGCRWMGHYCESSQHEYVCKWVLKACEYCNKELQVMKMEEHLDLDNYHGCDHLQRPCLFKQFGCRFKGTTHQLNQHEHTSREHHSYLIKMKSCNESIIFHESVFKQIHDGKYQILKQLYNIGEAIKNNVNSDFLVYEHLSEVKQLMSNNGSNHHQILDRLREIERVIEVSHCNALRIQNTQKELKRMLCGKFCSHLQ